MEVYISSTIIPVLLLSIIFGISYFKHYLSKKRRKKLKDSIEEEDNERVNIKVPLVSNRTKHPDFNVFKHRGTFFRVGIASALAFTFMAFSWTTYDIEPYEYSVDDFIDPHEIIEPPITNYPKPKPPPPPPPIVVEVPDEIEVEPVELIDLSIEADDEVLIEMEAPIADEEVIAPPPPPPPEDDGPEDIEVIVEQMPRFPGCNTGSREEKNKCSAKKLIDYLYKNLRYPNVARDNAIEGRLYVQFVVNKDGSISDAEVVRDIGGGCGKEALKVVNDMNLLPERWTPGKQRGRKVRVKYTLPVTFKLSN